MKRNTNKTKTILLCAAVAAVAGCLIPGAEKPPMFPEPFGNVRLGMSEPAFEKARPDASSNGRQKDGTTWWSVGQTNGYEEAGFQFKSAEGTAGRFLDYAMLCVQPGTPFREALAEAESRLGPALACRTVLFDGELCFQRTWRAGKNEATLFAWPLSTGTQIQWRIAGTEGSSAHDGFVPALPAEVGDGAWAGFRVGADGIPSFEPSGDLSAVATRRLFDALAGWESFDPVDLEARAMAGENADGHWIVEVRPPSSVIAIAADGSWIANLGADVPEQRRTEILAALATVSDRSSGRPPDCRRARP